MIIFLLWSELLCQGTHPVVPRWSPNIAIKAETVRCVGRSDEQMLWTLRACDAEHLHGKRGVVYRQSPVRCQLSGERPSALAWNAQPVGAIKPVLESQPFLTLFPLPPSSQPQRSQLLWDASRNFPKHWKQQATRLLGIMPLKSWASHFMGRFNYRIRESTVLFGFESQKCNTTIMGISTVILNFSGLLRH